MRFPITFIIRSIALLTTLPTDLGCSQLNEHPKKVVAVPAMVGSGVGLVAGIPIGIVLSPFAVPGLIDSSGTFWGLTAIPVYGALTPSYMLATLFGGPVWLADGWWGIPGKEDRVKYGTMRVFVPAPPVPW